MALTIEQMFEREGHRLKAFLERVNELGRFKGKVCEQDDEYGYELFVPSDGVLPAWDARATFTDGCEFDGDSEEPGQEANVTVFCGAEGGQILPSFVPHNYTPDVWCDLRTDEGQEELLFRLSTIEASAGELVESVKAELLELAGHGTRG